MNLDLLKTQIKKYGTIINEKPQDFIYFLYDESEIFYFEFLKFY